MEALGEARRRAVFVSSRTGAAGGEGGDTHEGELIEATVPLRIVRGSQEPVCSGQHFSWPCLGGGEKPRVAAMSRSTTIRNVLL